MTGKTNHGGAMEVHWRWHKDGLVRRVWCSTWGSDQFELVSNADFEECQRVCSFLGLVLREVTDD